MQLQASRRADQFMREGPTESCSYRGDLANRRLSI